MIWQNELFMSHLKLKNSLEAYRRLIRKLNDSVYTVHIHKNETSSTAYMNLVLFYNPILEWLWHMSRIYSPNALMPTKNAPIEIATPNKIPSSQQIRHDRREQKKWKSFAFAFVYWNVDNYVIRAAIRTNCIVVMLSLFYIGHSRLPNCAAAGIAATLPAIDGFRLHAEHNDGK